MIKYNGNNPNINIDNNNISDINNIFNRSKINKENLKNFLNQEHKSNIFNIKGLSEFANNNQLFVVSIYSIRSNASLRIVVQIKN